MSFLDRALTATRLEYWPVRVRGGFASGARWTLYPWSAYWRSTQEPAIHATLLGLGNITGWSCWDLGAHFGIYSVGLARHVGPTGQVAAFEPNPLSFARCEYHRAQNRLTWMTCFPSAVSDQASTAELYTYGSLRSTTTHLPYTGEARSAAAKPVTIRTVVLDELVAGGTIRAPQFIKVDVEGHGHHALAGARRSLAQTHPILIIAFHSQEEIDGVVAILQPLGYAHHIIGGDTVAKKNWIGQDVLFTPLPALSSRG